jgi:UDP-N-acetyl-2-amino-2-deoxyglucuronate dehydrogenase
MDDPPLPSPPPRGGREFGFGIVGCGVIAPFHARAVGELPNARLAAVCDVVAERAERIGREFGAPHLTDVDELLARDDVDVVSVCVPSGMHADFGVRAAAAGKHVVVEKPIDITLEAADRLIAACREHGVALTVISQRRYEPGVQEMRELIDAGRLGRLILGDAVIKWYRSQDYYDSGDWRGTHALDGGGCLMNQGVHYVDLLVWMMGPVDRVFARCTTAAHDIEVEDIAAAVLAFRSGAVGVLEASTAVFPGLPERLEVTGTRGTLIVEAGRLIVRQLKDEQGETSPYGTKLAREAGGQPGAAAEPAAMSHDRHRQQLADFLAALDEGREPPLSGEEARRPLEIILAVYESARTGREVTLPLTRD